MHFCDKESASIRSFFTEQTLLTTSKDKPEKIIQQGNSFPYHERTSCLVFERILEKLKISPEDSVVVKISKPQSPVD